MCGIIGIASARDVTPQLMEGLRRLSYRGYDSAGVAVLQDAAIVRRRAAGKLSRLDALLAASPIQGTIGIGHTRWATHGEASERNAHPHGDTHLSIVHNGIIENHEQLRDELLADGILEYESETDSEVIVHLLALALQRGRSPRDAMAEMLARLEGAFALAVLFPGPEDCLIGARRGSPLMVARARDAMLLGSDALCLAHASESLVDLGEGDWVVLGRDNMEIHDSRGAIIERSARRLKVPRVLANHDAFAKGSYRHFMAKEIHEQPKAVQDTLETWIDPARLRARRSFAAVRPETIARVTLVACGTAYYAALLGKYWIEQIAGIPAEAAIASEFRYAPAPLGEDGVVVAISQSGETLDTLEAVRLGRARGQRTVAIVNVEESAIARAVDEVLTTRAGPEISVASTKAFTSQLTVLLCFALVLAQARGRLPSTNRHDDLRPVVAALMELPGQMAEVLTSSQPLQSTAESLMACRTVVYLGRGSSYPLALEGALKLKEISYIHAEGHAGGEIKHGPIALIEPGTPVVGVFPGEPILAVKLASNLEAAAARGARCILVTCATGARGLESLGSRSDTKVLTMPVIHPLVAPILYAVPLQMLAYFTACAKGTDVDQPRNLAKSVTVE